MSSSFADSPPESPTLKFFSYDEFCASYLPQRFSLPESIVFYMAKNPPLTGVHRRMLKSCKYFFIKNPIIHFHCLQYDDKNGWKTCISRSCLYQGKEKYRKINLKLDKIQSKIFVFFALNISSSNPTFAASLIPKMYTNKVHCVEFSRQKMLFDDFLFFSKKAIQCYVRYSNVLYKNGNEVPCEVILANCPKLRYFVHSAPNNCYNAVNVAELLKVPHFKKLIHFSVLEIFESFDIEKFFGYLKKNIRTNVVIGFNAPFSEEYKKRLQAVVDEIIDAGSSRTYRTPCIMFDEQLRQKELIAAFKKSF
uniref:Uncharacterized protein n=1 Tax=Panagrolaimus superbus TaxID=310955 RepID=A0A914XUK8_9BILA